MPLIIITGLPTSGKSTRARQLVAYLTSRVNSVPEAEGGSGRYRIHLISDDSLFISRTVYDLSPAQVPAHTRSANASEKDARATIYGAVKRALSDRDIVILDGLNYIKGWRYQLFCEAKALSTPSVVLQIGCAVEKARSVNEERLARRTDGKALLEGVQASGHEALSSEALGSEISSGKVADNDGEGEDEGARNAQVNTETTGPTDSTPAEDPYEPENWDNLVFRYEEPNGMSRWDSPLFAVVWDDDETQTRATFDKLWDAIAGETRRQLKPNNATARRTRDVGADYLFVLERETQDVVRRILDQQVDGGGGGGGGGEVRIPSGGDTETTCLVVGLSGDRTVGIAQLQRHRRAFVGLNRGGIGLEKVGNLGVDRIRESFVRYLNDCFERE